MTTPDAELEFRGIRAAFATLRKMGYTWDGGQYWKPPPETLTDVDAAKLYGWFEVWEVRNGRKRSMDGYAYIPSPERILHFTLEGRGRDTPIPFGDQTLGYVPCKPPFKGVGAC